MHIWKKILALFGIIAIVLPYSATAGAEEAATMALKELSGKTIRLADYKGKVVVVNFWATWCPPCLEEIPDLVRFQKNLGGKGVQVIGVNYMERSDENHLKEFVKGQRINYPIVYDDNEKIERFASSLGGIYGLPVTKIFDRGGKLVGSYVGGLTEEQLDDFVKSLL
ncbi:MAG: TlpA family protein disulfide reductase [Magnetococcales bacterium]|nr:TlpA family protein disulfide reductase [Magnetococcales bacterium]